MPLGSFIQFFSGVKCSNGRYCCVAGSGAASSAEVLAVAGTSAGRERVVAATARATAAAVLRLGR